MRKYMQKTERTKVQYGIRHSAQSGLGAMLTAQQPCDWLGARLTDGGNVLDSLAIDSATKFLVPVTIGSTLSSLFIAHCIMSQSACPLGKVRHWAWCIFTGMPGLSTYTLWIKLDYIRAGSPGVGVN
jgi:hypothetical protein